MEFYKKVWMSGQNGKTWVEKVTLCPLLATTLENALEQGTELPRGLKQSAQHL